MQELNQYNQKSMQIKLLPACCLMLTMLLGACSKKEHPQREVVASPETPNTIVVTKIPVARVITVNDKAAKKSVDGRLYYDVDGRRYWKNYNDGKYYLFNKSMYNNPAFKPH